MEETGLNEIIIKNILLKEINDYNDIKINIKKYNFKIGVLKNIISVVDNSFEKLNDNINGLQFLLDLVFEENESKKIFNLLKDIAYVEYYTKDEKIFKQSMYTKTSVINKLNDEAEKYNLLIQSGKYELNKNSRKIYGYQHILENIKHQGYINTSGTSTLIELLNKYGYDNSEIIKNIEKINIKHVRKNDGKPNYTVYNMLDKEFEKFHISEFEDATNEENDNLIKSLYQTILKNGIANVFLYLPKLSNNETEVETFDYIMKNLCNLFVDKLLKSVQEITDAEVYADLEMRNVVIMEYKETLENFRGIRTYYFKEKEFYDNQQDQIEEQQEILSQQTESETPVYNLLFLEKSKDTTYFESDLKKVPSELYFDINKLLTKLKYNRLTYKNTQTFNGSDKLKKFKELRNDQIRILYYPLNNNNCEILGVFQKQDDNDLHHFFNIAGRHVDKEYDDNLEDYKIIEERIHDYIMENSRKRTR